MTEYELFLRGVAELECSSFHNASVPMIGFSEAGDAIILTEKGILELVDMPIGFGCPFCVAVIDKKTLKLVYKTAPSWHRGNAEPVFQYDGSVYWKLDTECLELPSNALFASTDPRNCMVSPLTQADVETVERIRDAKVFEDDYENERLQYDLYDIEGGAFLAYVYGVVCT